MSENLTETSSAVTFIGVCTVALNKDPKENTIQFYNKRDFPMGDGEATADVAVGTSEVSSGDGTKQTSKVLRSTTNTATWKGFDSNRVTAPDVRVGSLVMIFQIGDADEYYWFPWDIGPSKHRLERVTYAFNASPKENENTPFSYDSYYVFDFNPMTGMIRLSTSKANGELASYVLTLNGATGNFAIMDDKQNLLNLDSTKNHWLVRNADDSICSMLGKSITLSAKESITMFGEKSVGIKTKAFTLISETANIKAETLTILATTTQIQSNTTHVGNIGVQGDLRVAGGNGGGGSITTSGGITATEDITAGGISVMRHIHDVIDHSYTGTPKMA